jgi:hypothetical protein
MAVHGRYREPCPVCATPVQRIAYAENETNYCATCQTGGKPARDPRSRGLRADWLEKLEELEELKAQKRSHVSGRLFERRNDQWPAPARDPTFPFVRCPRRSAPAVDLVRRRRRSVEPRERPARAAAPGVSDLARIAASVGSPAALSGRGRQILAPSFTLLLA